MLRARPGSRPRRSAPSRSRARPRGTGIHAGATLDLRYARPLGRSAPDRHRRGLHRPHAGPGQPPSPSSSRAATSSPPPRPAPARPPPSRCPSSTACAAREHLVLAGPPPGPRADPGPDPRARDAGRRERADLRPHRAAAVHRRLRRRPDGAADQGPARRRRDPRRHARAACSTSSARRTPTSARSRSSSSTRPTGCSTWASCPTSSGSSSCSRRKRQNLHVLGDVLGRHPAPVRARSCATRRRSRWRHGTPPRRRSQQLVYPVDRDRKEALLAHLVRQRDLRQVLVFTRTKLAASRLASRLDREGIDAVAIHSDRSQPERTRALEGFKSGEIRVLVATDVAARGLDIEDLPVVVNFELPWNPQDYIHRIGRTGRAGADRRGDLAGLHRRGGPAARHPADAQEGDPVDGRGRLRPGPERGSHGRSACAAARGAGRAPAPGPAPSITSARSPSGDAPGPDPSGGRRRRRGDRRQLGDVRIGVDALRAREAGTRAGSRLPPAPRCSG